MTDSDLSLAARKLFLEARTASRWLPQPVSTERLHELYELVKCGPTSMNTQPMRLQFVVSPAAKERLAACVNPGNVEKTLTAPVVAIIGQDMAFAQKLPVLFAHKPDAMSYYEGKPDVISTTALRNSSLQGGYLIMAARLLGLDCGPMSGFNASKVDEAFWTNTPVRTNFLCNLGHADRNAERPRPPRLSFDEVCSIV
jgi:3-hydroxypropanoate dehydrogenase